jgi:hypothetical protein
VEDLGRFQAFFFWNAFMKGVITTLTPLTPKEDDQTERHLKYYIYIYISLLVVDVCFVFMCVSMSIVFVTMSFMSIIGLDWCLLILRRERGKEGDLLCIVNILVSFCYYFGCLSFVLLAESNSKYKINQILQNPRGEIQRVMTRTHDPFI